MPRASKSGEMEENVKHSEKRAQKVYSGCEKARSGNMNRGCLCGGVRDDLPWVGNTHAPHGGLVVEVHAHGGRLCDDALGVRVAASVCEPVSLLPRLRSRAHLCGGCGGGR